MKQLIKLPEGQYVAIDRITGIEPRDDVRFQSTVYCNEDSYSTGATTTTIIEAIEYINHNEACTVVYIDDKGVIR